MSLQKDKLNATEFAEQHGTQQNLTTTGFGQNAAASAAQTIAQDLPISKMIAHSDHISRDNSIRDMIKSGEIPDSTVNQFIEPKKPYHPAGYQTIDYAALGDHLAAQGNEHIPTQNSLNEQMQDNIDVIQRNYDEISSRQSNTGWVGSQAGAIVTSMGDPVNLSVSIALPVTKIVPSTLWGKLGTSFIQGAAVGLATEIVTQPLIMDWKEDIGVEYGLDEAIFNATVNTFAGGFLDMGGTGVKALYGKGKGMLKGRKDVSKMSPKEVVDIIDVSDEIVTEAKKQAEAEGNQAVADAAGEVQTRDTEVKEELKQSPADNIEDHIEGTKAAEARLQDIGDVDNVVIVENPFEATNTHDQAFMDDIEFKRQMKENAIELDAKEKLEQEQDKADQQAAADLEAKAAEAETKSAKSEAEVKKAEAKAKKAEAKLAKLEKDKANEEIIKAHETAQADKAEAEAKIAREKRKAKIKEGKPVEPKYVPRDQKPNESENAYMNYLDSYDRKFDSKMEKYEIDAAIFKADASSRSDAPIGEAEVPFKPVSTEPDAKTQEAFDVIESARGNDDTELDALLDEDLLDYENDLLDIETLTRFKDCMDG